LGYCGAEGTGIIINQAGSKAKEVLSSEEIEEGKRIGKDILVLEKALELNKLFKPSLFHDATEGGIFGALTELVAYKKVGIKLDGLPPLSPITEKLANWLKFDPYRLISSGALIMAVSSKKSAQVKNYLQKESIPFAEVGTVIEKEGIVIYKSNVLELPSGDEIIVALENLRRLQNVP
ncbi:MAG: AIR synthase-related protein, partial [Candidatus Heimdallarchaeaceae archaeon]